MPKPTSKSLKSVAALPADFGPLLAEIKRRVKTARIMARRAANRERLALYWDIGGLICKAQRTKGYGKQVVERLAADMQRAFPRLGGFSPLNVWRMRAFYLAYTDGDETLSQAVTGSSAAAGSARSKRAIVQQAGAQLRKQASGTVQVPLAQTTQAVAAIVQPPVAQMGSPKYQISNPESCLNGNRIVVITA